MGRYRKCMQRFDGFVVIGVFGVVIGVCDDAIILFLNNK